jgi:hypothetical protein
VLEAGDPGIEITVRQLPISMPIAAFLIPLAAFFGLLADFSRLRKLAAFGSDSASIDADSCRSQPLEAAWRLDQLDTLDIGSGGVVLFGIE